MAKKKRKQSDWQKHVKATMGKNPNLSFGEVLKKASKTYKKGTTNKKTTTARRKRTLAKKNKTKKKRSFTIPIAPVAALFAVPFIRPHPDFGSAYEHYKNDKMEKIPSHLLFGLTGFWIGDQDVPKARFDPIKGGNIMKALIVGVAAHWLATKVGINRLLGRAKVPLLRV